MTVLHIDSTIQGELSASRAIGAVVVEMLRAGRPDEAVIHRDLGTDPLPHIALDTLADVAGNAPLQEFLEADTVVIGVPMINFAIPSQLKAWVDHIVIAGTTFRFTEQGPEGLAGNKRVILAIASGGIYGAGSGLEALEHAESYLRSVFAFLGVTAIETILADGLKIDPDKRDDLIAAAVQKARAIEVPAALAA